MSVNQSDGNYYPKRRKHKKKYDIKELNIPNVCFSLSEKYFSNKTKKELKRQRIRRGFDDTELWSLYTTIGRFILPRLKAFREGLCGHPAVLKSEDQWREILDKMIFSFDYVVREDEEFEVREDEYYNRVQEGLDLFSKYFFNLWD
jgi:hypothetical protein